MMGLISIGFCTLVLVGIGIWQIKSKKPVTFWTGEKRLPVEAVTDMASYNKKHGIMWILYGLGMLIAYLIGYYIKSDIILAIAMIIEACGGAILMMLYHNHLYKRHVKK